MAKKIVNEFFFFTRHSFAFPAISAHLISEQKICHTTPSLRCSAQRCMQIGKVHKNHFPKILLVTGCGHRLCDTIGLERQATSSVCLYTYKSVFVCCMYTCMCVCVCNAVVVVCHPCPIKSPSVTTAAAVADATCECVGYCHCSPVGKKNIVTVLGLCVNGRAFKYHPNPVAQQKAIFLLLHAQTSSQR